MSSSRFMVPACRQAWHSSWLILAVFAFGIFSITGCALISKKDKGIGAPALLEPQSTLKFADIPVPAGFKLLSRESYAFETTGVRVGVLKYQGKADPDQIINFYKEQMPMYNWNLLNIVEYGSRLLNFDRDRETCIINLLPKGNSVAITISVGPKPQMPKKSDKPVK